MGHDSRSTLGTLATIWGVVGFLGLLGSAIWRLFPVAWEPIAAGTLTAGQTAAYVAVAILMIYSEGYRGFQLKLSPRFAARALYLSRNPRPLLVLFAPFFCVGLVHASRRRLIASWILTTAIIGLVLLVRSTSQPWRGIIDGGVVLGLAWGATATGIAVANVFLGRTEPAEAELP